jgi:hypothetical protein
MEVTVMAHVFLGVMCSGLVALVTAFALATPNIRSAPPRPADEALLVHLLPYPASASVPPSEARR